MLWITLIELPNGMLLPLKKCCKSFCYRPLKALVAFVPALLPAFLLAIAPAAVLADTKRVTVPIALPFQQHQAASSAATSVAPAPQALQTTQFTQTLSAPVSTPVSSTAVAEPVSLPVQNPLVPSAVVTASSAAASSRPAAVLASPVSSATGKSAPATVAPKVAASKPVQSTSAPSKPVASKPVTPAPAVTKTAAPKTVEPKEPAAPAATIPLITTAPIKATRYPAGHPEAFVAEFENYVATKIAPFVPGVAIVIVSGGQIKSLQGYGVRRAGTREKITPDTVFRLASLSKPVASTAASALVHEGRISWDTTITSVLSNVSFKNTKYGNQLTLRHALSQSSGLPRHTYSHYIDQNMNYADVVKRLRYVNFVCPPGKCYAYQNVAYSLAGDMIKQKSGMSFEAYVGKKVFEPLGMRSASYGLNNYNASPNRASPHIANGNRWVSTAVVGNWYKVAPAAGVNASIVDMSKFLLGQIGRRQDALPLSVITPIQTRTTKNTPEQNYYGVRKAVGNTAYGLGWRVFDYGRNKNFVHHGGHVKGFRTEMVFNRELQIGMVFLSNSETRLARDVIFKFLDMHERAQQAARSAKKQ